MPKIEQTIADVNVRAHTFKFVTPPQSDAMNIPNACNLCHTERTTAWAAGALKSWGDRSPWRIADAAGMYRKDLRGLLKTCTSATFTDGNKIMGLPKSDPNQQCGPK